MIETYERELLKRALPESLLWNFAGRPKLKKHNKFVMFWRWLLRKEPDYEYSLPKNAGTKIKFRRYA